LADTEKTKWSRGNVARVGSLHTLPYVREEIARLYRAVTAGHLESGEGTRRVYILRELRACLEAENLHAIIERLDQLEALAGQRRLNGNPTLDGPIDGPH
jgi:hypothetical protein